jgi:hypothetical protein
VDVFDRVKQSATGALKQAADVTQKAAVAGAGKAAETLKDPVTHTRARHAAKQAVTSAGQGVVIAGHGVKGALDKVNPACSRGLS